MRTFPTLFTVIFIVAVAAAQAPQAKPLSSFEQELMNNQNRYVQAFADKDTAYVNQAIADDFKGIGTNGDFYDKGELVGASHWGLSKDVRAYDVQVVRLTDDSAVVTYVAQRNGNDLAAAAAAGATL